MRAAAVLSLAGIALLAAGGAWIGLRGGEAAGKKTGAPPAVPVALAQALVRDMPVALALTGRTEAYETVTLKPRVDGQVLEVAFADGQRVAKGELLVRLDPADFQARLRQAEANLARSQAQAAKARGDLERYRALQARGFVSEEKVAEVRTSATAAEATAQADQATADLARLQIEYTSLRAPFAGRVGPRLVFPGSTVKANDTALAVLNRVQPLQVAMAVPERHLPALRAALAGPAPVQALIRLPGGDQPIAEGRVRALDNAVDPATGTLQVKALTDNRDEALAAGQFVDVTLVLGRIAGAVAVPTEAVQQSVDGPLLFVVKDEAAAPRRVRTGPTYQGLTVIEEGLAAGETVVTDGHLRLTPGARVKAAGGGKPAS